MPSTKRLNPMEIITEVQSLRGEIEQRMSRIFELSEVLYGSVRHGQFRQERERIEADLHLLETRLAQATRREEPNEILRQLQLAVDGARYQLDLHDEAVPVYTMFANAWKRFSGTMYQGLRRTASIDRLIGQVQEKQGVTPGTPAQPTTDQAPQLPDGGVNDLVELYGEETVNE